MKAIQYLVIHMQGYTALQASIWDALPAILRQQTATLELTTAPSELKQEYAMMGNGVILDHALLLMTAMNALPAIDRQQTATLELTTAPSELKQEYAMMGNGVILDHALLLMTAMNALPAI